MQTARHVSRGFAVVLAAVLSSQVPLAHGEIVDTDALAAPSQVEVDRAKVQAFMDRANVKERLQAMGVSGLVAGDRVASLSEAEVHALAERIDTMPAGGALSTQDWILIGLVALLVLVLL
ncbi:PA2779 family protein [Ramlibacter sp. AW1]|uniref:PA2779 family protein n=1 Tax=Ramlibacter aurantiacus TaxID=2801330 RepID=A0A937D2E9_9BURK|nr:PA2779 family protein [Ramlibacter aurantiacus]MBL0419675.1 PA2779 family protein [Ramlibacter aurantiacus]